MRRTSVAGGLVGCLCAAAGAQTFVIYQMAGENRTDDGRGLDSAQAGDVIRMSLTVEHDGFSFAGGKAEMLYSGVSAGDITLTEDAFGSPYDPWEIGRHVLLRIIVSDGPADATQPHNEDVVASDALASITDVNDDFFDFASTPPALCGICLFGIASGDPIFIFDYMYDGGVDLWDAGHNGEARLWRHIDDVNGIVVPAFSGDTLVVSPHPREWCCWGSRRALRGVAGGCDGSGF